ncbi:hypothetical protein EVAR_14682_1 [Eumeta japonica]|uniref:Uncharacterized protein n=1 Tax=Eumeta variegata TaxID=151549 RepID=A0A4C1U235_EUMVA|nr:hypothetical protein EVAR_14682_1 [Eumeta japonica]
MSKEVKRKIVTARLSGVLPGLSSVTLRLAVCIPKTCSSSQVLRSITADAIDLYEDYCRLPDDKPYVPADYVAL